MSNDVSLDADSLHRRREHLMSEIDLDRTETGNVRATPRRAYRLVAAVAVVAALSGGAFVALSGGPGTTGTAFAMERSADGTVSVRVVDSDVSAAAMTRQLRAAGLDVRVETMSASRQLVGTWVYVSSDGTVPEDVYDSVVDQTRGYTATLELPAHLSGGLVLGVGRAPRPGERIGVSGRRNALAPGGLLHCERLTGVDATTAATRLTAAGWTVTWSGGTPAAGARVAAAYVSDDAPRSVELSALRPDHPKYDAQSWLGFAPSLRRSGDRGC